MLNGKKLRIYFPIPNGLAISITSIYERLLARGYKRRNNVTT